MSKEHTIQLNLWHLSWPMFIERMSAGLVMFADTYFLSMISDEAAASVGMLGAVMLLGYFILPLFTSAGTSVASQYMGAEQEQHVVPTYIGNLAISVAVGAGLALGMFLFSSKIGFWLGMTVSQNSYAETFMEVIAFNFIFVGARFSYASILASKTLTRWNMVASVLTNILNVFLNWALLTGAWFFPELGIRGIALATIISYITGLAILAYMVHVRLKVSFFIDNLFARVKTVIPPILKIGIPSAIEPFSYTIQAFVVSVLIIKLGLAAMGANTYVFRLLTPTLNVSWTLTLAGQIIMSHHLGARRFNEVHRTYIRIAVYSIIFAVANVLLYLLFHNAFLSIFTQNAEIKRAAFWILVICLFLEPMRAINILGGIALKTVGDGKFSATMSIIFMWGLIPVIIVASHFGAGIVGLWGCLCLDETVRAVINFWRWSEGKWKSKSVIRRDDDDDELPEIGELPLPENM